VAVAAVGLIRSLLCPSKGAINASGADYNAPGARDYSAQGHVDFGARDIPAPSHGALDGAGGEHAHAMGGMLASSIAEPSNRPGMARG